MIVGKGRPPLLQRARVLDLVEVPPDGIGQHSAGHPARDRHGDEPRLRHPVRLLVGNLREAAIPAVDRYLDALAQVGPVKAGRVGPGVDLCRSGYDPLPLRQRPLVGPQAAADGCRVDAGFLGDLAEHRILGRLVLHRARRDLDAGKGMLQQQKLRPLLCGPRDKGRDLLDNNRHGYGQSFKYSSAIL